jgi:hypothetical protein
VFRYLKSLQRAFRPDAGSAAARRRFRPGLEQLGTAPPGAPGRERPRPFRPGLEALEERLALSHAGNISAVVDYAGNEVDYFIGADHALYRIDPAGGHALGGYVTQISAGKDAYGRAECFAIGGDHGLFVNDAYGWHGYGGYVTEISGTANNEAYAIGPDHALYKYDSTGWQRPGGIVLHISAGTDAYGRDQCFAIGNDNACYVFNNTSGWQRPGGYVTEIAGTAGGAVFAKAGDHTAWLYVYGNWYYYGGYIL